MKSKNKTVIAKNETNLSVNQNIYHLLEAPDIEDSERSLGITR